jgi:hypothetical protein
MSDSAEKVLHKTVKHKHRGLIRQPEVNIVTFVL